LGLAIALFAMVFELLLPFSWQSRDRHTCWVEAGLPFVGSFYSKFLAKIFFGTVKLHQAPVVA
jgi:hypothetical protein